MLHPVLPSIASYPAALQRVPEHEQSVASVVVLEVQVFPNILEELRQPREVDCIRAVGAPVVGSDIKEMIHTSCSNTM